MFNRLGYDTVRKDTLDTLDAYVNHGLQPGGFVTAVLENNLMEAFARADLDNRRELFSICSYVYNELPAACHGSPEKVKKWYEYIEKEKRK